MQEEAADFAGAENGDSDAGQGTYSLWWGDKETWWLGFELAGDTDYHFHEGETGNLGSLSNTEPIEKPAPSEEEKKDEGGDVKMDDSEEKPQVTETKEADAMLSSVVFERLPLLLKTRRERERRIAAVDLALPEAEDDAVEEWQVSPAQVRRLEALHGDPQVAEAHAAYGRYSSVIWATLKLGLLKLQRALGEPEETRTALLVEAERVLVSIQEDAQEDSRQHAALGEVYHWLGRGDLRDEVLERARCRHPYEQDVAGVAGDRVARLDLGEVGELLGSGVGLSGIQRRDLDERRQRLARRGRIDHGAVAGDHASALETAQAGLHLFTKKSIW